MKRAKVQRLSALREELKAAGFITMKTVGRRKAPSVAVRKIVVEIDPYWRSDPA